MKLLLDELLSRGVADQLRARGHDVLAVQDPELRHLRGTPDAELLAHAAVEQRAVVTDNVADVLAAHRQRLERGEPHHGLLLVGNETFPRHRHDRFVGLVVGALTVELEAHPEDDGSSWIRWLVHAP